MPKPKRYATFSTRSLLVSVALFAIVFATFGGRSIRAFRERHATSEIRRLGGRFDYMNAVSTRDLPWHSRLMANILYEAVGRVTNVSLGGTTVSDDDLAELASLSQLQRLDISSTEITDDGLARLEAMPQLRYINAYKTKLSELAVRELMTRRPSLVIDWEPMQTTGQ